MKTLARFTLLLALGLALSSAAIAEETLPGMDPAQMEKMKAAMAPNEHHQPLEQLAGNWAYTARFWMAPDQPAQVSTGTSSARMIYDGRFVHETVHGTWAGQPFEGQSVIGYDNIRQEYQSVWIDSSMTGIMTSKGKYDAATKTFTLEGKGSCPLTGEKNRWGKMETTITDADHHTMTSYAKDHGKVFKTMEIVSTRV